MILNLAQASGIILQWYDEAHIDQYDPCIIDLPPVVRQACDFIAEQSNSDNELEQSAAIRCLFADLVEAWNDSFSMRGRNAYAAIFGRIVWKVCENDEMLMNSLKLFNISSEDQLQNRYLCHRQGKKLVINEETKRIVVLSRVTIGADILLSSVVVKRLRQQFPDAEIIITGNKKLYGLFGSMPNLRVEALDYARRGSLSTRLRSWISLHEQIRSLKPDLVVAPDSRLDQLGMLPICSIEQYALWENLQLEDATQSLSSLADHWICRILDLHTDPPCYPELSFSTDMQELSDHMESLISGKNFIAVKLDYGGNSDKALSREWEIEILRCMIDRGWRILIDRGFGDEELKNSDAVMRGVGMSAFDISEHDPDNGQLITEVQEADIQDASIIRFYGSIAAWAAATKHCQLAFSYDSVGHHLAAALGTPLVIAFTGYKDEAFPIAWQPRGPGEINIVKIPMDRKSNRDYLSKILDHITRLTKRVNKA